MKKNTLFSTSKIGGEKEWIGMPEFVHDDKTPYQSIIVHFRDNIDLEKFADLIHQNIHLSTKSIWYPKAEIETCMDKLYMNKSSNSVNPKYPLYIVSKGRWKSRLTSNAL